MITINILHDFSEYPGLRYNSLSDSSGEDFYHNILNKKFQEAYTNNDKLVVNLDYTAGYASSFLDEAFGNLVYDFSLDIVKKHIEIISTEEPHWINMLKEETFKQWEERRRKNQQPKITKEHESWYRLINGSIKSDKWESLAVV